nr:MAG TPA: endonuclease-like protein [Caudoviricetes sp.]
MLKERGNLIAEGIPLTRDLLEFALGNDYKISLRTGDYGKEIPKSRAHYDDNLLTHLYNLYVDGDCYLPQFIGIFDLSVENLRVAFKKRGLGMLNYEERFRLYGKNIFEQSCATQIANHGRVCNFSDPEHHARAKATMVEEYKVDNPSKLPEFQNKKIQTNIRKRGVKWPAQDPNVRAQQIATLMENWKVDNPSKNPELQAKKAVTVEKSCSGFGFASPILSPIIQATNLANLGVENPMQNPEIARKNQRSRADNDPRYEALLNLREMKERGEEITDAQVIEVAGLFGKAQEINILKEFGVKEPHQFTTEIKVQNLLDSLGVDYIRRARSIHGVKKNRDWYELDIFIPELNLGIEINGRAYHSVNKAAKGEPKTPEWHFEKFKAFRDSGILMISFTDYEQDFFTEDYVNIIKLHLGLLSKEDFRVSEEFLEFNQISSIGESLNYGLFDPSRFTGNFEDHQHQRFIEDFEYWDCGVIK